MQRYLCQIVLPKSFMKLLTKMRSIPTYILARNVRGSIFLLPVRAQYFVLIGYFAVCPGRFCKCLRGWGNSFSRAREEREGQNKRFTGRGRLGQPFSSGLGLSGVRQILRRQCCLVSVSFELTFRKYSTKYSWSFWVGQELLVEKNIKDGGSTAP